MNEHTKEPWDFVTEHGGCNSWIITSPHGNTVGWFGVHGDTSGTEAFKNMCRIKRCVNACAGIEKPEESIRGLLEAAGAAMRQLQNMPHEDVCDPDDCSCGRDWAIHMVQRALTSAGIVGVQVGADDE